MVLSFYLGARYDGTDEEILQTLCPARCIRISPYHRPGFRLDSPAENNRLRNLVALVVGIYHVQIGLLFGAKVHVAIRLGEVDADRIALLEFIDFLNTYFTILL
jgi:hypothetical protein